MGIESLLTDDGVLDLTDAYLPQLEIGISQESEDSEAEDTEDFHELGEE